MYSSFFRKIITTSLLAITLIGGFFGNFSHEMSLNLEVSSTYAGTTATSAAQTTDTTAISKSSTDCTGINCAARFFNTVFEVVTIVVTPAIVFASWLLSPDWTTGDLFGLRDTMYKLWITISNIIYFVYAILLIIIALGTIFGNEKFGYKVMLPRLALGILMVPFTWFFVQWVISVSSFLTASVVSIPEDILTGDKAKSFLQYRMPREFTIDASHTGSALFQKMQQCTDNTSDASCVSIEEFLQKGGGIYGNLLIYAYGVFKIDNIQQVSGILNNVQSIGQLVNQLIVGVLMFVVFGVLVIALIFMLMMRIIKLWVYAIFSPLFTLHFVAGKELLGENMDDFSLKEFIGLCFVPAVVGLSLSFGLVVISAITGATDKVAKGCTDGGKECTLTLFGNPENKIVTKLEDINGGKEQKTKTTVTVGSINLNFEGEAHPKDGNLLGTINGGLGALGGLFGTIVIDLIALIFIWMAFMAAKGVSKAVSKAVEPFESMGNKIGQFGAQLPQYTPIPGLGLSLKGIDKGVDRVVTDYKDERNIQAEKRINELIGSNKGLVSTEELSRINKAITNKLNGESKIGEALKPFADVMSQGKTSEVNINMMRSSMDAFVKKIDGFGVKTEGQFADKVRQQTGVTQSEAEKIAHLFYNTGSPAQQEEGAKALGKILGKAQAEGEGNQNEGSETSGEKKESTTENPKDSNNGTSEGEKEDDKGDKK